MSVVEQTYVLQIESMNGKQNCDAAISKIAAAIGEPARARIRSRISIAELLLLQDSANAKC
jgi:hypothetical protein